MFSEQSERGQEEENSSQVVKHNIVPLVSKRGTRWLRKRIQDYGYELETGRWTVE